MQDLKVGATDEASAPSSGPVTYSVEQVFAEALEVGEWIACFGECLRQIEPEGFERAAVALTQRRVLLVGPAHPAGYELKEAHDLHSCTIANGRERPDGSRLLVMRSATGAACLYFAPDHAQEAEAIVVAIGFSRPEVFGSFERREVDTFEMGQELHALSLAMGGYDEDEDS